MRRRFGEEAFRELEAEGARRADELQVGIDRIRLAAVREGIADLVHHEVLQRAAADRGDDDSTEHETRKVRRHGHGHLLPKPAPNSENPPLPTQQLLTQQV